MARLGNLLDSAKTLAGGASYYDYELAVGRSIVVRWLSARIDLAGRHVGDFGCHAGGILQALREAGAESGEGFDLDERAVRESPFVEDENFTLTVGDALALEGRSYDLVILRDVLEHVPRRDDMLAACRRSLRPGGALFVSFPPYYSPFGGHQQVAANWPRLAPYLHVLPGSLFFRLVRLEDNVYLRAEDLLGDMTSVRQTRLTIGRAERAFRRAGLGVAHRQFFLLRPEYAVRYGLPSLGAGPIGAVPLVREALVMGAFYLLTSPAR